jgi:hypothetical protein
MAFDRLRSSRLKELRKQNNPVFCVGWQAFVHWPKQGPETNGPVPLWDASGRPLVNNLADGEPVEILAWQPRSRDGLLYRIMRLADKSEWWINARHLRRCAVPS